ncbi:hypothetical protein NDN08_007907 [Rhodosorus marinus]|uniref:Methyltransferase type 11 domain-containing protein n=1 Tax=Rhodosorus marinus TaxID=101924 RepID=A0AAV8UYV6_9RHOD|nr:hypothetical protein NDN08_007907 [Rhodosorus marinus]
MVGFVLYASGRQISTVNVPATHKRLVREISVGKGPPLEAGERRAGWGDASGMLVGGAFVVSGVIAASTALVKKRKSRERTPDTDLSVVDELGKRWLHGFGRHNPEEAQQMAVNTLLESNDFDNNGAPRKLLLDNWTAEVEAPENYTSVPFDAQDQVDVIVSVHDRKALLDPRSLMSAAAQRLKPGGLVVVLAWTLRAVPPPLTKREIEVVSNFRSIFGIEYIYAESELVSASLIAGLRFVETEDRTRDVEEYWSFAHYPNFLFGLEATCAGAVKLVAVTSRKPTAEQTEEEEKLRRTFLCEN